MALVAVAVTAAITSLSPLALKMLVDRLASNDSSTAVPMLVLVLLYIGSTWLGRVLGEVRSYIHAQADRRMYRSLCDRVFDQVMALPLRYHLERKTGALTETLTNGLQGYQMIFQSLVFTVLPVFIEIGTVALILISLKQTFFLLLFVVAMVCYAAAFRWGATRIMQSGRGAAEAQIGAWGVLTDSIINYETVKYFTAESVVRERFDDQLSNTESRWMQMFKTRSLVGLMVGSIFAVFLAIAVLYSAVRVQSGAMTLGTFVLVHTYMFRMVQPLEMIGYATQQLSQGFAFLERLVNLFRETPELLGARDQRRQEGPGSLEFKSVRLAYHQERVILRDVSFRVPAGKTLGIVGSSGAGKSTIVRLLVRLVEPDAGGILLDGVPLADIPLTRLREVIAVVPQDTVLFNDTIGYNIGFGKPNSTSREIEHAAKLAHLDQFIRGLPEGYETRVGERGVKLSGGEKQRVSIARAAIKQPLIYVFDEATSSLDSQTEREILRNLREISSRTTTVIIAHRLSTVVHADEIVVLEGGVIVERGDHASLLSRNGRYAHLWDAQQNAADKPPARSIA